MLNRFLVYFEPFPNLCWTVSLCFEPCPCLFWTVSLFILSWLMCPCFARAPGMWAPLGYPVPPKDDLELWVVRWLGLLLRCARTPEVMSVWDLVPRTKNPCLLWAVSLFILNSFLVYVGSFPCLCWAVPCLLWAVSLFILSRTISCLFWYVEFILSSHWASRFQSKRKASVQTLREKASIKTWKAQIKTWKSCNLNLKRIQSKPEKASIKTWKGSNQNLKGFNQTLKRFSQNPDMAREVEVPHVLNRRGGTG